MQNKPNIIHLSSQNFPTKCLTSIISRITRKSLALRHIHPIQSRIDLRIDRVINLVVPRIHIVYYPFICQQALHVSLLTRHTSPPFDRNGPLLIPIAIAQSNFSMAWRKGASYNSALTAAAGTDFDLVVFDAHFGVSKPDSGQLCKMRGSALGDINESQETRGGK